MAKYQFSEEQIKYIKENWDKETAHSLKKKFGCTWYAVNNMAKSLGLEEKETNYWTEEEILQLKELAPRLHYKKIAKKLNKTSNAVYLKARKLNITLIQSGRKWTKEEEEKLKEEWGNRKVELIAKEMQRTVFSLRVKAVRMKLGAMILNNTDVLLLSDISELLNVTEDMVRNSWLKKGLKMIDVAVTKNKSYKAVTIEDLMEFLRVNQEIWDSKNLERNILGLEPVWLQEKRKNDLDKTYKTYNFWTEEEKKEAIFWLKQGNDYEFIAEKVKHSAGAVAEFLRKEGYIYLLPKYWKTKEIKFVRENMDKLSTKEMAVKLKKNEKSVEYMKNMLAYKVMVNEPHNFTLEEDNYLRENYLKVPNYRLANEIGDGICREVLIERLKYLGIYQIFNHEWTNEEDSFIMESYNVLTIKEMAEHLGVNINTVRKRLKFLGIYQTNRHKWTEEEDNYLRENYQQFSVNRLSKYFKISNKTMIRHLKELNLYQEREKWTIEKDNFIMENYNVLAVEEMAKSCGVSINTVRRRLMFLGVYQERKQEWTLENDVYLKENYGLVTKKELMKKLKIGAQTLNSHLERLGLIENNKIEEIRDARRRMLDTLKELLELKKEENNLSLKRDNMV